MKRSLFIVMLLLAALLLIAGAPLTAPPPQADDPSPPDQVVKLIFIHHSSGENWLADDNGGLGIELGQNNYFVSDTNYGWGPDAIGDRTDIPNWVEWFRSQSTDRYMDAVYNESGQNSSYARSLDDPGSENEIIMFKSCFPNSNLDGHPNDPPGTYEDMTVSGAKYVYNEILKYFATRPDKLFVLITAPPVSDPALADNARAFNNWLVNDWLRENNYAYSNVAVFDFYNVLTGQNNHHRYVNGQVEHVYDPGKNTTNYPSGDDHPSSRGNRKATEEFLPLLNIYYHRWQSGAPAQPPAAIEAPPVAGEAQPPAAMPPSGTFGRIVDFESGNPADTGGWEQYMDDTGDTSLNCAVASDAVHGGSNALKMEYDVTPTGWAVCTLYYGDPADWSAGDGLSFYYRSTESGRYFDVDIYAGSSENQETYIYTIDTTDESAAGWVSVQIPWSDFKRSSWEENPDQPFTKPDSITGFGFGIGAGDDPQVVTIWVDDIQLLGLESQPIAQSASETQEEGRGVGGLLPCSGTSALLVALLGLLWIIKRH